MLDFPFCFWFQSERHALLMRSPSGCRGTQMFFFPFCLWFQSERHTRLLRSSPGCRRMQKIFVPFCFLFQSERHALLLRSTPGCRRIGRDQPIKSTGLRMHGLGQCRVMGVGFARTPSSKIQGLANRIDRFKNAQTRIVQGFWDQGLRARRS